jgi:DNA-directed RNA polymerase subunit RPC12/RpoP
MAMRTTYKCLNCGFKIDNWSDGNPYIATPDGKRHYWHHPGQDSKIREICELFEENPSQDEIDRIFQKYSGCESQYICKKCLGFSMLDESKDELKCKACGSSDMMLTEELAGKECPSCRKGKFDEGECTGIS